MPKEKPDQKKTAAVYYRTSHCKESDKRTQQIAKQQKLMRTILDISAAAEFVDYGSFGEAKFWRRILLHIKQKNHGFRKMLAYLKKNPTDTVIVTDPDRLSHDKGKAKKMMRQIEACGSKVRVLSAEQDR
jgi:DNA invertase Pin-like site-specific DNA recombinase